MQRGLIHKHDKTYTKILVRCPYLGVALHFFANANRQIRRGGSI